MTYFNLFLISFTSLITFFAITLFFYIQVLRMLKNKHVDKWQLLGQPGLFSGNSIKHNASMFFFLKKKEFQSLDDDLMSTKCKYLWTYFRIYLLVFVATATLLFLHISQSQ